MHPYVVLFHTHHVFSLTAELVNVVKISVVYIKVKVKVKVKVKQSRYRPGVAQRVPGS
jgi:hypothetical protein